MFAEYTHIQLEPNGDPYGRGFVGTLLSSNNATVGPYMGDVGAKSRQWWRNYARKNDYKLIEK